MLETDAVDLSLAKAVAPAQSRVATPQAMAALAQRNAALFIAVLVFQDVFLLTLHRLAIDSNWQFYRVSQFSLANYLLYVMLALFIVLVSALLVRGMRAVPKIRFNARLVQLFVGLCIAVNLLSFSIVGVNARYVSGGLTGAVGIIYALSQALSLAAMVLAVKFRANNNPALSLPWAIALAASYAATIDGLASAITLSAYILLIVGDEIKVKNILLMLVGGSTAILAIFIGFSRKFSELPSYMTPDYMAKWLISRLSISAEQGFTFISGDSLLNRGGEYFALIERAFQDRMDILTGGSPVIIFPRSVSEALYYDMYGQYDAGSSPGFFLSLMLNGFFSIPVLYIFIFLTYQMFYGVNRKFSLIGLIALVLITKIIYVNISEYFVILSPVTLALAVFVFACLIETKPRTS